jgi:hypothetical protein
MSNKLFAILDKNNVVMHTLIFSEDSIDIQTGEPRIIKKEEILQIFPGASSLKEYSEDKSITNNPASINSKYNEELNAFIPQRSNDTYILNTETFEWGPNPNIDYDLYGDGTKYKWYDNIGWLILT